MLAIFAMAIPISIRSKIFRQMKYGSLCVTQFGQAENICKEDGVTPKSEIEVSQYFSRVHVLKSTINQNRHMQL